MDQDKTFVAKLDIVQKFAKKVEHDEIVHNLECCHNRYSFEFLCPVQFICIGPVHVVLEGLLAVSLRKAHNLLLTLTPTVGACSLEELRLRADDVFVRDKAVLFRSNEYGDSIAIVTAGKCQI